MSDKSQNHQKPQNNNPCAQVGPNETLTDSKKEGPEVSTTEPLWFSSPMFDMNNPNWRYATPGGIEFWLRSVYLNKKD